MSRNLTVTFLETINSLSTGEAALFLLTIYHESWVGSPDFPDGYIRIVNNNEDVVSRGNTFKAYGFDLSLAMDDSTSLPSMNITIDNVDRLLISEIRSLPDQPEMLVELILSSDPDTVEIGFPEMTMDAIRYNAATIIATIVVSQTLNLKYPKGSILPPQYPGLY